MTPDRITTLQAEAAAFGRATISRADLAAFEAIGAALGEARAFVAADAYAIATANATAPAHTQGPAP